MEKNGIRLMSSRISCRGIAWPGLFLALAIGHVLSACGTVNIPKGPLSESPALDRYERRIFVRPDESFLDCFVSVPFFDSPAPLVFLCQGSGYASMFEELPLGGCVDITGWVWAESRFRHEIRLVFVEKRGVRFGSPLLDPEEEDLPPEFLEHDTLEERVRDVLLALEALMKDPHVDPERVALVGHGEGASVAASAALACPKVTHLGFLSSGGHSRLLEMVALKREALTREHGRSRKVEEGMDRFFEDLEEACEQPGAFDTCILGATPAYLHSYGSYSPLEDLLRLEIPVFVALGGSDPLVPLFSGDAIRLAFLKAGRTNLSYRVYPGLDHAFFGPDPQDPKEEERFQFPRVFDDFCQWFLGE